MILDYIISWKSGKTERLSGEKFNNWCLANHERISPTVEGRRAQLARWSGQDVKDWEMIDE